MSDQTNQPIAGTTSTGRTQPDVVPQHPNPASITPERAAAVAAGPEYRAGKLTRAGMDAVHAAGGSVLHEGRVIPPGHPLPSEADLAVGDESAEQAVRDSIEARRRALDDEERKLSVSSGKRAQQQKAAEEAAQRRAAAGGDETFGHDKLPLSHFDGMTDEQILSHQGVGEATLKDIKAAQRKRDKQ